MSKRRALSWGPKRSRQQNDGGYHQNDPLLPLAMPEDTFLRNGVVPDDSSLSHSLSHLPPQPNKTDSRRAPIEQRFGYSMRVYVPDNLKPGDKVKVRYPDGSKLRTEIPPRSEWKMKTSPYFIVPTNPSDRSQAPLWTSSPSQSNTAGQARESRQGKSIKVHLTDGMEPGNKVKVRCTNGKPMKVKVPPRSAWMIKETIEQGHGSYFIVKVNPHECNSV